MKHILVIVMLLAFVGSVSAQSTYLNPYRSATHTYLATVVDAGEPNPVRWYVSTDALGVTKAIHGTDYTFITPGYNPATSQLEGSAVYSVQIQWGAAVSDAANYYVYIEVDDDVTNCTNRRAMPVQIAANFNAVVFDVTGSSTPGTVDPVGIVGESCPDDPINPVWNAATNGPTDIGYTELIYRVNRQFSVLAWQFEYLLKEGSNKAFAARNIRMVNASGTELYNGTNLTGTIPVAANQDYVVVYVQITNQQGATLDVDLDLITTNNNTRDANNHPDSNLTDNNADHTIQPLPVITGFSGN